MLTNILHKIVAKPNMNYMINGIIYTIPKDLLFTDKQYMLAQYKLNRLYRLLKYITKIFKQNNIKYVAICGTLLSALRHNALMPWDDDIDLAYNLIDHEKIKLLINKFNKVGYTLYECTPGFVIQDMKYKNICADLFSISKINNIYKYSAPIIDNIPTFQTSELFPKEYFEIYEFQNLTTGKICDINIPIFKNSIEILKRCYDDNVMLEVRGVASTRVHILRKLQFIIPLMELYLPNNINKQIATIINNIANY